MKHICQDNSSLTSRVQGETRRTFAAIRAVCVDAGATALTDTTVELALVDVRAVLAVHLCVALGALAEGVVADLAWAAPGHADRAATFRAQGHSRQIVLATTVHHLGPAGASPIVWNRLEHCLYLYISYSFAISWSFRCCSAMANGSYPCRCGRCCRGCTPVNTRTRRRPGC